MSNTVISVENVSKKYNLGVIGTGTFRYDLKVWWARVRNKPNPLEKLSDFDHKNREGDSIWALRNVSFKVNQGEALGIIGRNGAGKSTILKILSRVTAPTLGEVKVKGRIASLLEVGTGFHPELTGRENIFLNGAIMGMSRAEVARKFDEIVDFSGVERFIDTPVKRYSSGMYVRLAFAVAAHLEPEILIVDEVLAVGDADFQQKCLGKMGDVAKEGRTVLFVSHNLSAIRNLCSSCILLSKGEVETSGDVNEVIATYQEKSKEVMSYDISLPKGLVDMPGEGTRLRISTADGTPSNIFKLRESWKVVYEFKIMKKAKQVVAGFHLLNNENVTVLTCLSAPKDLEPDNYQVEFLMDQNFSSGQLHFVMFLLTFGRTVYWQRDIWGVTITDEWLGTLQPRLYTSVHGIILARQNEQILKSTNRNDIA